MVARPGVFSRRLLLRGVAGAVVAAPFLSSLREARGESPTPPRRLAIFYTHNGCLTDRWWPDYEDGPLSADTFTGTTLEVLNPYYRKLLLPRGFRSVNTYGQAQNIDPHDQAMGSKLTCAPISTDNNRYALGESVDHTIAKQINPGGRAPLVLGVGAASTTIKSIISFSGPSMPSPANVNPQTVYAGLTGVRPLDTVPMTEADYHVRRGQSVIDLVRGDLERLQGIDMSRNDQKRIQDWLDLLRDTEVGMSGTPSTACSADTATSLGVTAEALTAASPTGPITGGTTSFGGSPIDPAVGDANLATSFTLGGDMMMNLMALSMICDTNRVLVMTWPGYVRFNWDGISHTTDHCALSHRTGVGSSGGACMPGVLPMILQIDQWYAKKYAHLVGLLDSIGEGDGTLLDNTATLWLQELSDGAAHNLNNLPLMIAGGAGGYLRQGYAVNVEGNPIGLGNSSKSCQDGGEIGDTGSTGGDVPINKLYVTLMNALGCTADGTPEGGKVTEFGQFDGPRIDDGITNPGEVTALLA